MYARHQHLLNEAEVSPITECGDESITVTKFLREVPPGNFNSWNKLVVAANMAKKAETLVVNKQPSHKKSDKPIVHDIDVRWHHCDQDGCDYKAKQACSIKQHKQSFMILTFDGTSAQKSAATTRQSKQAPSNNTNEMFMILTFDGTLVI